MNTYYINMYFNSIMLAVLPSDILRYVLLPLLDDISVLCLKVALHLHNFGNRISFELQRQVIDYGVEFIEYFVHKRLIKGSRLLRVCAEAGNLPMLRYFHRYSVYHWDAGVMYGAVTYDSLSCLKYALSNTVCYNKNRMRYLCIKYGSLQCMKCLHEHHRITWNEQITTLAVEYGHIPCIQYINTVTNNRYMSNVIHLIVVYQRMKELITLHNAGVNLQHVMHDATFFKAEELIITLKSLGYQ